MGLKDSFLKKITAVKAARGDAVALHRELMDRREQALQRVDYLHNAPLARQDVFEMFNQVVDAGRQDYAERLSRMLEQQVFKQGITPGRGLPLLAPWSGLGLNAIIPAAIFGLLGHQLMENLNKLLADMPWPEAGPSIAERRVEIEKLNRELSKIEGELAELESAAKSAGIMIQ